MNVDLPEEDVQAVALALVTLSRERPGWRPYLREIAGRIHAGALFDGFEGIPLPEWALVKNRGEVKNE